MSIADINSEKVKRGNYIILYIKRYIELHDFYKRKFFT